MSIVRLIRIQVCGVASAIPGCRGGFPGEPHKAQPSSGRNLLGQQIAPGKPADVKVPVHKIGDRLDFPSSDIQNDIAKVLDVEPYLLLKPKD